MYLLFFHAKWPNAIVSALWWMVLPFCTPVELHWMSYSAALDELLSAPGTIYAGAKRFWYRLHKRHTQNMAAWLHTNSIIPGWRPGAKNRLGAWNVAKGGIWTACPARTQPKAVPRGLRALPRPFFAVPAPFRGAAEPRAQRAAPPLAPQWPGWEKKGEKQRPPGKRLVREWGGRTWSGTNVLKVKPRSFARSFFPEPPARFAKGRFAAEMAALYKSSQILLTWGFLRVVFLFFLFFFLRGAVLFAVQLGEVAEI